MHLGVIIVLPHVHKRRDGRCSIYKLHESINVSCWWVIAWKSVEASLASLLPQARDFPRLLAAAPPQSHVTHLPQRSTLRRGIA